MQSDAEKGPKQTRVTPGGGKVKVAEKPAAAETPAAREGPAARSIVAGPRKGVLLAIILAAFVGGVLVGSVGTYLVQSRQGGNAAVGEDAPSLATITASPVSAPTGPDKLGTTTITWDTGDGSVGQVYVAPPGKPEKLFADNRSKGTQQASWIGKGEYEFRLFAGKEHERVLARVKVKQGQ
jgi:hypothetical protein